MLTQNIGNLPNYKELSTKEIQYKIFGNKDKTAYLDIWKSKYSKHISINYKIAFNLMPIIHGDTCSICGNIDGSIKHLLLNCQPLKPVRDTVEGWLLALGSETLSLNERMIIYSRDISSDAIRHLLSEYKIETWLTRNKIKFDGITLSTNVIKARLECKMRFYLTYLIPK